MTKKDSKHYIGLDILRIFACILIFLYHLNIIKNGFLLVCMFLVLSGYLMTTKYLKEDNFLFKDYYLNRLKKIYLPLIIIVFLTIIFTKFILNNPWFNLKRETLSIILGYNNFWQINANMDYFTKHLASPFIHLWYISLIIQIDLLFPIIFKIFKKMDNKINKYSSIIILSILFIISIIAYYLFNKSNIMMAYYNPISRCFPFIFGVIISLLYNKFNLKNKFNNSIIFIVCISLLIILSILPFITTKYYLLCMIITTIISGRLIICSNSLKNINNKVIKYLASITYEIYLIQYIIIYIFQNININLLLKNILIILITIIISIIIHFILNTKFNNKLCSIINKLILIIIIILGSYILITIKDDYIEMKELENRLNENEKLKKKKNDEYKKIVEEKQKEIEEKLKNLEIEEQNLNTKITELPVIGIGDSVLLGASDALYEKFPNGYFDGKVSRTIKQAEEIIENLKNENKLSNNIILALANNGDYSNYINEELMNIIGNKEVFWINAVGADDPTFNEKFSEFAKKYPNIHIIKWDEISLNHDEYFYADGIHLKSEGMIAYANTIYDAIYNYYLSKINDQKGELTN